MGFRFSINHANAVGHLVNGNVVTFLKDMGNEYDLRTFIDRLFEARGNLIIGRERENERTVLDILKPRWETMKDKLYKFYDSEQFERNFNNIEVLSFMKEISNILSRCQIKSFLIPGFEKNHLNNFLVSRHFLRELVHIHPYISALILQLEEIPYKEQSIYLLNSFTKFQEAYKKIDQWPGVLFWNDSDSIFVPVSTEREIIDLYEILKYEKDNFNYIRNNFIKRKKEYAHIFHISDLHFGNKLANKRKGRILKILEKEINSIEDYSKIIPVITGDMVDTPCEANVEIFNDFKDSLKTIGFEEPIQILGNHDVSSGGIFNSNRPLTNTISSLSDNELIKRFDDIGLAIVKFNSNTDGELAQGKIGENQFLKIGNELDSLSDGEKLTLIAVLHHHPRKIDNPKWYAENFIEKTLGKVTFEKTMKLKDAEMFLEWLNKRNIKYVLHGHKHIPVIHKEGDINIIGAGSATGVVHHIEKNKTYMSFNLIKYDVNDRKPVSCIEIFEELIGSGATHMHPVLLG